MCVSVGYENLRFSVEKHHALYEEAKGKYKPWDSTVTRVPYCETTFSQGQPRQPGSPSIGGNKYRTDDKHSSFAMAVESKSLGLDKAYP